MLLRPSVTDLTFRLYDRPLHPELFDIVSRETVTRPDFQAQVRITRSGHVITWSPRIGQPFYLTEVVTTDDGVLPGRQLLELPFRQERFASVQPRPGIHYQACCQIETLPPELFLKVNDELLRDGRRRGFIHFFEPSAISFRLAPLSLICMDGRPGCQLVHAFHTFPDEYTVIKSQSLFECRWTESALD